MLPVHEVLEAENGSEAVSRIKETGQNAARSLLLVTPNMT